MWRKGNPSALLVGMQTGAATVENTMEVPQKTKNGTAHCCDYTLRTLKVQSKRTYVPSVHNSTIYKCWKQPKCPSLSEWIRKPWYIYTTEYYAAERKKELLSFARAWIELESIMLSEISPEVRDK